MISKKTAAAACALTLTALPVSAGSARTAARPVSRTALYDVNFSGSQSTVWHYSHVKNQSDPCDAGSSGDGSQMIRFYGAKQYRVVISQPTPRNPYYHVLGPRPLVFSEQPMIAKAIADREGTYKVDYNQIDTAHCQAGGSGDGGDTPVPLPDCGKRTGTFTVDMGYAYRVLSTISGKPQWPEKNWIKAVGTNPDYGRRLGLDETYRDCPYEIGGARYDPMGAALMAGEHLTESRLFADRTILVHLSGIYPYNLGDATGKTIVTYNIRLRPVK